MVHSMRPTLLVTIPSSEKASLNHGTPSERGPTAPQSAPPELLSRVNVSDRRAQWRYREGRGRPREGIFRHKMHHPPPKAGDGGILSTYRGQDSDDDGLLRPVTRETTRSRWGSEPTCLGTGSRRSSILDGLDKSIRLGSIKRREEIQSMDDLQRVRDQRSRGEEHLRSALSVIGTLATDVTRRLDYTYYGLLEKIAALNVTIASFQDLSDSTSRLFDDFKQETTSLEQDIQKQISDLHEFHPQMQRVEALEERMRDNKTRAKTLGNRLETMRNEIEMWDKREMEWQMRTNRRLRIFWGGFTAAILAILVVTVLRHWPSEGMSPGFRTLPKALKLSNTPIHAPLSKHYDAFPGNSEDEYGLPPEPTALVYSDIPSVTKTYTHAPSAADETTRPADYDPLRIFDELLP